MEGRAADGPDRTGPAGPDRPLVSDPKVNSLTAGHHLLHQPNLTVESGWVGSDRKGGLFVNVEDFPGVSNLWTVFCRKSQIEFFSRFVSR